MSDVITTVEAQTIVVESDTTVIETTSDTVIVSEGDSGPQGPPGPTGPTGPSGIGDKTFSQPFTSQSSVTVIHNLGKFPAVTVVDSAGDQCEGDIVYLSNTQLTVEFSASFSGTIVCN